MRVRNNVPAEEFILRNHLRLSIKQDCFRLGFNFNKPKRLCLNGAWWKGLPAVDQEKGSRRHQLLPFSTGNVDHPALHFSSPSTVNAVDIYLTAIFITPFKCQGFQLPSSWAFKKSKSGISLPKLVFKISN